MTMGDYDRTTQEVSYHRLRPEILAAIEQYLEDQEWDEIESTALFCCETTNERKKKGLLGKSRSPDPDPVHYTAAIVTPDRLFWARSGEKSGTHVTSMQLNQIEVRSYQYGHMIEDTGLSIYGFIGRATKKGELFLGLGQESAAEEFRRVLEEAVKRAST
jgi:hypothetical protein